MLRAHALKLASIRYHFPKAGPEFMLKAKAYLRPFYQLSFLSNKMAFAIGACCVTLPLSLPT